MLSGDRAEPDVCPQAILLENKQNKKLKNQENINRIRLILINFMF